MRLSESKYATDSGVRAARNIAIFMGPAPPRAVLGKM